MSTASSSRRFWGIRAAFFAALTSSAIGLCTLSTQSAWAQNWPADALWVPLTKAGQPIGDPDNDQPNDGIDIVGNASFPAMFVYRDTTHLFFRMRLDGTPLAQQGSLKPFAWGCEIDTDGNLDAYEFLSIVDGIAGKDATQWWRNSTPSTGGKTNDPAERLLIEYLNANWRVVSAGTNFPLAPNTPNEDFFLDWALALADLANPPQAAPPISPADIIDLTKPITLICGTSANKQTLTKDFIGPGVTLTELAPDPLTCGPSGCAVCSCSGGQVCDPATGQCVQCTSDAQCSGETPNCNLTTHTCECTAGPGLCSKDTDGDGLSDGEEIAIGTDPSDADSDDDGVPDGQEPTPGTDSDGDGLVNALDSDSDNDGLYDGTELGLGCSATGTDAAAGHCVADGDAGATKTDPTKADTDGGGVSDGSEDVNLNGVVDSGETNPTEGNGADDTTNKDDDGDGLSNGLEATIGTDPTDADSDDDGLPDGLEPNPADDTDGDGKKNALDPDSDGDGLFDGTEAGRDCSGTGTASGSANCVADADKGVTTTGVLSKDTDHGGVSDGDEDKNHNGMIDSGETDPNDPTDDVGGTGGTGGGGTGGTGGTGPTAGTGATAGSGGSGGTQAEDKGLKLEGGGCGCRVGTSDSAGGLGLALGALALALARRRRRATR